MVFKIGKNPGRAIFLLCIAALLILTCKPTVFSPHAQNEMITPYNRTGEVHERGGALAFNKWMVKQSGDTVYNQTYPNASISFFHNAYYGWGNFGGIGGIEIICLPAQWWGPGTSGFILWAKPYLGLQYDGSIITFRLNLSPLSLVFGYTDGEWDEGGGPSMATGFQSLYQSTILLHNRQPSDHTYWGGIRNSPGALGLVGGYEYSPNKLYFLRAEYSYLVPAPFSLLLSRKELESLVGSVHYLTFGIFTRIK